MKKYDNVKNEFLKKLSVFADSLNDVISYNGEWNIKGFIDRYKKIYTISSDTKVISKILELHIFPNLLRFAEENGYSIELAECQNWYPDITLISKQDENIKFAIDLKTTYRDEKRKGYCNGFTLGSHGKYFIDRKSKKNIQYPYSSYIGHFCLGIIYSRAEIEKLSETKVYDIDNIEIIPSVIKNFIFFAQEKWKIAGEKGGSGNTANIGSICKIEDILSGNGIFSNAGEEYFDDYWANYGKIQIADKKGGLKKMTSFSEYLEYRGLPQELNNKK